MRDYRANWFGKQHQMYTATGTTTEEAVSSLQATLDERRLHFIRDGACGCVQDPGEEPNVCSTCPVRPALTCIVPGCHERAEGRDVYCEEHRAQEEARFRTVSGY